MQAFNYSSVLIEIISRSLGLNSKEAKRKAAEKAKSDSFVSLLLIIFKDKRLIIFF